jgi:hypothetical protein
LPIVAQVLPSSETCDSLFRLLTEGRPTAVTVEDARRAFHRNDGDMRSVWFDLYDLHEATRPNLAGTNGVPCPGTAAGPTVMASR